MLVAVVALLSAVRVEACGVKERIVFDGFERVTHLSTSGMNLWVEATNRSCWRMVVAEAEVTSASFRKAYLRRTTRREE